MSNKTLTDSDTSRKQYVLGIDVGTGSTRAGLFDTKGKLIAVAKQDINLFSESSNLYEQSSDDIWSAVCFCVRDAIRQSGVDPSTIIGIGFDATCSLVVIGADDKPLAVGDHEIKERNIIVWMDHRAIDQAERINAAGHEVLRYIGNRISPEMETPKLLWLKENRPQTFAAARHFFDLTDYLSWRATGSLDRSICTTTCKWTYLGHKRRWDESYFRTIGLQELADEGFKRIGCNVVDAGSALGKGLSTAAADDFGLVAGTAVAAGLIDAHAGGIGTVGAYDHSDDGVTTRMAYVFGTSACTMTSTIEPAFVPGVWGPYFSAMVPGLWLNEAGQSAAGAAIDHLISFHPVSAAAAKSARKAGVTLTTWLAEQALTKADNASNVARLADRLNVVPEFLGNRAPFADPNARGLIAGLDMDKSFDSLIRLYIAGICGLGYGLRQIIEAQRVKSININTIVVSGGAGQNPLVRQLLADTTQIQIAAPKTDEPVLLGSAMLGSVAAGYFPDLTTAMASMSAMGAIYTPANGSLQEWHEHRYKNFELLQSVGRKLR